MNGLYFVSIELKLGMLLENGDENLPVQLENSFLNILDIFGLGLIIE